MMNEAKLIHSSQIRNYLAMINDKWRNQFFYDALMETAGNKVVLDVGSGTGILSAYALEAGAKFVYAVEQSSESAKMTEFVLGQCFDKSRFKVINCNFWTDSIDNEITDKVDILVSETVGPRLVDQGMCVTWYCAKNFLAHDAISIPDRLHLDVHLNHPMKVGIPHNPEITPYIGIFCDELILSKVADAIVKFDEMERVALLSQTVDQLAHPISIDDSTIVLEDIVSITKDTLPAIEFDKFDFPNHIYMEIKFNLKLDENKTVSLENYISYRGKELRLNDAKYMPWKFAPTFQNLSPGEYEFMYNKIGSSWSYKKL